MNTIQEQWEIFKKEAVPSEAMNVQVESMKLAFYAGCISTIHLSFKISEHDEEAAAFMLDGLLEECDTFFDGKVK